VQECLSGGKYIYEQRGGWRTYPDELVDELRPVGQQVGPEVVVDVQHRQRRILAHVRVAVLQASLGMK
jgi:hypothetical protein